MQTAQLKMLTQAHQIPHIVGKGGGAYLRRRKGGKKQNTNWIFLCSNEKLKKNLVLILIWQRFESDEVVTPHTLRWFNSRSLVDKHNIKDKTAYRKRQGIF